MRIETESDYYYDTLNIHDRFTDEVIRRYGTLHKASKICGRSRTYLYAMAYIGSVQKLNELCQKLNIDFDYIISGKDNTKNYHQKNITLSKILKLYEENKYKSRQSNSVKAIVSMIRKGKTNIKVATLLYFADLFKLSPLELL